MKTSHSLTRLFKALALVVMTMLFSQPGWVAGHGGTTATVYCKVDAEATGANNGTSWTNAFSDLQSALGESPCTEIWVAAGTYKPTTGIERSATFQLKDGVALYGGFAGTETARDQRDPSINVTILSGDLNGDDAGFTDNSENVYHVVSGASGASMDGFTITAGNANGNPSANYGGGMFNNDSSPSIKNVTFSGNYANNCGGGMANLSKSSPQLTDVTFDGNNVGQRYASGFGGGLYNEYGSPELVNVTFHANSTNGDYGRGGGMYNYSGSPRLTNVIFNGNTATNNGGGLYNIESNMTLANGTFSDNSASRNGGGMYNGSSSPILTNVTFSGNSADYYGGGMWNTSSSPMLTNVTFSGNAAGSYGGGMYNDESNPQIRNTIFWGNSAVYGGTQIANGGSTPYVRDSVVQDGCPAGSACTYLITTDPLLGTLGDYGGFTQTIPLQAGSSAIDAGNDATCAASDQRGITRPQGAHCDIGAFEYFRPTISGNAGVAEVTITYTGGSTTANCDGDYSFAIPYGWSGIVTPSKTGASFSPDHRSYTNVTANQTDQDFMVFYRIYLPLMNQ